MNGSSMICDWRKFVSGDLFPSLHGHLSKCLADVSFGMAISGCCQSGRLSCEMPTDASPASSRRRIERLLSNERLNAREAQQELTTHVTSHWSGRTLLLLLDETPKANDLRVMSIRAAYSHRAVPLAAECYRPNDPPCRMPRLVRGLLDQVRRGLPEGMNVVLLADRGLAWPTLVDWCVKQGWHYVLRLPYDDLLGVASGATGNPAILVYASRMAPTERPDIGYAMIFPSATIAKVIAVQVIGLIAIGG